MMLMSSFPGITKEALCNLLLAEGNSGITRQIDVVPRSQQKSLQAEQFAQVFVELPHIFPLSIDADISLCPVIGEIIIQNDLHAKQI